MKILRRIGRVMGCLMLVLVIFISYLCISHHIKLKGEEHLAKGSYGKLISVEGKKMCVEVVGEGEDIIILLPGLGSVSPVLEMRPIANALKTHYTVVTIEPFGYGLSDTTERPRTISNIVDELHEAIKTLGYDHYVMMGHSMSGAYSLKYADTYPDEVKAYIGIDSTVPKQILVEEGEESSLGYNLLRLMNQLGIYRFLAEHDEQGMMPQIEGYTYTENERKVYEALAYKNLLNDNMMAEFKNSKKNLNEILEIKFPDQIPVFYFLASENCNKTPQWEMLHKDVITNKSKSRVVILEGEHYLHYRYVDEMANQVYKWLNEIK